VTYVYRPPATPVTLTPKPTSAARTSLSRIMTLHDTNLHGNVHGGVILHLVDELGGAVAARHSGGRAVTASMDEFQFLVPVAVGDLVRADAQVNWAGRTSVEVGVRVVAEHGQPRQVPPVVPETPEERRRVQEAEIRRAARLHRREEILRLRADKQD
jgi:uncharacterized protein (TIGR00369 family)